MEGGVADLDRETRVSREVVCRKIEGSLITLQSCAVIAVRRIRITEGFQYRDPALQVDLRPNCPPSA